MVSTARKPVVHPVARLWSGVLLALLFVLIASSASAAGNEVAVHRCQELMPAFVKAPLSVTIDLQDKGASELFGVRIGWRAAGQDAGGMKKIEEGWIICWFLPRTSTNDAWQMTQLDSNEFGVMRRYDIQQLYKMLRLMQYRPQTFTPEADTLHGRALYVLQQTLNALSLGCVYALIAIGFTLVYGITRVINFAFGDLYMFGAFCAYLASIVIAYLFGSV